MPYIRRGGNNYIEIVSDTKPSVTITAVPTAYTLNTLSIPKYTGAVRRVVMELRIQQLYDESGLMNDVDSVSVSFNDGAAWYPAFAIATSPFVCPASSVAAGMYILSDGSDIKQYITSGLTITTRLDAIAASHANLKLMGVQTVVKIYFI